MRETAPRAWQQTVRRRLVVASVVLAAWAAAIEVRLVWLQVFQYDFLEREATNQRNRTLTLEPRRGDIVDRHGRTLAISVDAMSICAIPKGIDRPADAASAVCRGLGNCTAEERRLFVERLSQHDRSFAWLRRQASIEEAGRVEALKLPGIFTRPEPRRYYPNRNLAAHVLGYFGTDNKGLAGIEQSYDSKIKGTPGKILVEVDSHGRAFSRVEREAVPGDTLELTIDTYLQHLAEKELALGVAENRALGGTVLIMDPRTGEILAMANAPGVNPNAYREFPRAQWMNRAVQGIYEPGSTFKVVTASAAMEERTFRPTDLFDVSAGQIRMGQRLVEDTHRYGVLSFTDVLVKSSNVGAIKIGFGVGAERLGRYARRLGFGERLSVDLPGETPGMLKDPRKWSQSTLMSVSMGYEVGIALQMATAVSSVANGGALVQPRVVRALRHGRTRTEVRPLSLRSAISPATAAELVTIMEQVVEDGTATSAQIPGYTVAGKTGTASKIIDGQYSKTEYHSSFVGFVPSRRPEFTILVVIDAPHAGKYYGGAVAAPIFQRIASAALRHLGVPPTIDPVPPVLVRALVEEDTAPPELLHTAATADPPQLSVVTGPPAVPDVSGLGAREAARRLAQLGLIARLTGDGVVIDQDPAAGTPLELGRVCRLWLDRLPPALPAVPPLP